MESRERILWLLCVANLKISEKINFFINKICIYQNFLLILEHILCRLKIIIYLT